MHQHFCDDADLEYLIIDRRWSGRKLPQKGWPGGPGRSRAFKIHVILGNIHDRKQHDITQAEVDRRLCWRARTGRKGTMPRSVRQHILELGMMPVIPPRSNRKEPADYDRHLYRERHLVECFIIKHYRRIFSRFEKLDTRRSALHRRSHLATVKCQQNLITLPSKVFRSSRLSWRTTLGNLVGVARVPAARLPRCCAPRNDNRKVSEHAS